MAKLHFKYGAMNSGKYLGDGDDILIDGTTNIKYISLCGECYCKKVLKLTKDKLL